MPKYKSYTDYAHHAITRIEEIDLEIDANTQAIYDYKCRLEHSSGDQAARLQKAIRSLRQLNRALKFEQFKLQKGNNS